jgi:hypothetical protein
MCLLAARSAAACKHNTWLSLARRASGVNARLAVGQDVARELDPVAHRNRRARTGTRPTVSGGVRRTMWKRRYDRADAPRPPSVRARVERTLDWVAPELLAQELDDLAGQDPVAAPVRGRSRRNRDLRDRVGDQPPPRR